MADDAIVVALASDHRGVKTRKRLAKVLTDAGYRIEDHGTDDDEPCDYPDFAARVSRRISDGTVQRGVLICGTGIGMAMVANKFPGVRAAACYDEVIVEISRRHNDVNVLCLPGDLIGGRPIGDVVLMWLRTAFDGGRHKVRLEKLGDVERGNGLK